jgi:5-methylcytosine-specific restriction endonuclease McrA
MVTESYKRYINSPAWARKRQECFAIHGKRCKACFKASGPIHVHHLDYSRLGNESARTDLMPLCMDCHRDVTRIYRRNRRRGLRRVTLEYVYSKRRYIEKQKAQRRQAALETMDDLSDNQGE